MGKHADTGQVGLRRKKRNLTKKVVALITQKLPADYEKPDDEELAGALRESINNRKKYLKRKDKESLAFCKSCKAKATQKEVVIVAKSTSEIAEDTKIKSEYNTYLEQEMEFGRLTAESEKKIASITSR